MGNVVLRFCAGLGLLSLLMAMPGLSYATTYSPPASKPVPPSKIAQPKVTVHLQENRALPPVKDPLHRQEIPLTNLPLNGRLVTAVPLTLPSSITPLAVGEHPHRADELFALFQDKALVFHMEAIRRAATSLTDNEKWRLLSYLATRRDTNVDDPRLFFDFGYADIVLRNNKTGLFFLRKAHDRLRSAYTSLAYAMAQADIDLTAEHSTPTLPSARKLDVVYKLNDAIRLDAKQHTVGFWPTFVRVQQHLSQYPAYADFSARDYSDAYVPYLQPTFSASSAGTSVSILSGCQLGMAPISSHRSSFFRSVTFLGQPDTLEFLAGSFKRLDEKPLYQVRLITPQHQLLGQLNDLFRPETVESLLQDGQESLIFRQFRSDPWHPVRAYHFTHCKLEPDTRIEHWFD